MCSFYLAGYLDSLQVLNGLIAELDVYVSLAQVALSSQTTYVRPKLHPMGILAFSSLSRSLFDKKNIYNWIKYAGSGVLKLHESRHPCLELQEGITFIPNDVEFQVDEKMFCIITGALYFQEFVAIYLQYKPPKKLTFVVVVTRSQHGRQKYLHSSSK